jgi:hypothetical protein
MCCQMDISAAGFHLLCPAIVVTIRVGERIRYPQKYPKRTHPLPEAALSLATSRGLTGKKGPRLCSPAETRPVTTVRALTCALAGQTGGRHRLRMSPWPRRLDGPPIRRRPSHFPGRYSGREHHSAAGQPANDVLRATYGRRPVRWANVSPTGRTACIRVPPARGRLILNRPPSRFSRILMPRMPTPGGREGCCLRSKFLSMPRPLSVTMTCSELPMRLSSTETCDAEAWR